MRVVGTCAGAVLGLCAGFLSQAASSDGGQASILAVAIGAGAFCTAYVQVRYKGQVHEFSYAIYLSYYTSGIIALSFYTDTGEIWAYGLYRALNIIIGVTVSCAASLLIWPRSTKAAICAKTVQLLRTTQEAVELLLETTACLPYEPGSDGKPALAPMLPLIQNETSDVLYDTWKRALDLKTAVLGMFKTLKYDVWGHRHGAAYFDAQFIRTTVIRVSRVLSTVMLADSLLRKEECARALEADFEAAARELKALLATALGQSADIVAARALGLGTEAKKVQGERELDADAVRALLKRLRTLSAASPSKEIVALDEYDQDPSSRVLLLTGLLESLAFRVIRVHAMVRERYPPPQSPPSNPPLAPPSPPPAPNDDDDDSALGKNSLGKCEDQVAIQLAVW